MGFCDPAAFCFSEWAFALTRPRCPRRYPARASHALSLSHPASSLPQLSAPSEEIEDWITRNGRWMKDDEVPLAAQPQLDAEFDFDSAGGALGGGAGRKLDAGDAVDIGDDALDEEEDPVGVPFCKRMGGRGGYWRDGGRRGARLGGEGR